MLILSALVSGLGLGSMYGLIALGYHVTYAVSRSVNFAQGSMLTVGTVLAYAGAVTHGLPWGLAVLLALLACGVLGLAVEAFLVRPFVRRGSKAWLMATVAGGIVADNLVLFTFGNEPRSFPSVLAARPFDVLGIGIYPLQLLIPLCGLGAAAALHFFGTRTRHGKAMLAVVQNAEAARLMGINLRRVVATAFAVSAALAGLAGILIAPLFNVSAEMGMLFGIKAFAVAILGGIGSAWGVMLAGLLYGAAEALVTALLGSSYTQIVVFSVVIASLALLPNGLFGRAAVKKV